MQTVAAQDETTQIHKPRLVAAKVVAERLGITTNRVYELAAQGILPCVRLGRQVRFDPEKVEALVASGGQALPGGWRQDAAA